MFFKILQNSQKNNCARPSFLRTATLLKKEALGRLFSCEYYEILKNTFFTKHLRTTASMSSDFPLLILQGTISHIFRARENMLNAQSTMHGFLAIAELIYFSDCVVSVQSKKYLLSF